MVNHLFQFYFPFKLSHFVFFAATRVSEDSMDIPIPSIKMKALNYHRLKRDKKNI